MSIDTKRKREILIHSKNCVGCLRCQLLCSITFQEVFNPAEAWINIQRVNEGFDYEISFTDDCTYCGICAKDCSYGALELRKGG